MGLSLMSFGRAAMISCFGRPLSTGMRNLTSETLDWYSSLTLATNSALGGAENINANFVKVDETLLNFILL